MPDPIEAEEKLDAVPKNFKSAETSKSPKKHDEGIDDFLKLIDEEVKNDA